MGTFMNNAILDSTGFSSFSAANDPVTHAPRDPMAARRYFAQFARIIIHLRDVAKVTNTKGLGDLQNLQIGRHSDHGSVDRDMVQNA